MKTVKRTAAELTKAATFLKELLAEGRDMMKLGLPAEIEKKTSDHIKREYDAWCKGEDTDDARGFATVYELWISNGEDTPAADKEVALAGGHDEDDMA